MLAALVVNAVLVISDLLTREAGAVPAPAHHHTAAAQERVCVRLAAAPGLCTHGPDAPPEGVGRDGFPSVAKINKRIATRSYDLDRTADSTYSAAAVTAPVVCGTGGARVQAVYAHHPGANRYSTLLPTIRRLALVADDYVNRSAAQVGAGMRIRWATTSTCKISVKRISVGTSAKNNFNTTINALAAAGLNRHDRKYVVWLDTADGLCGIGTSIDDDRASQFNVNNQTTGFSQINRRCWGGGAEMHELFHTLGAVQRSAPRSTAYGHCRDERDAMCYLDGPGTTMIKPAPCPSSFEWYLDCNKNDYFNPKPKAGTYIATHWNTAKSKWLQPDDPPPSEPTLILPAVSRRLTGIKWSLSSYSKSANGTPVSYRWAVKRYSNTGDLVAAPACSFSSATARQPLFWCSATFPGPVVLSVQATDGKGLTNVTQRHVNFAIPSTPLATVFTAVTNPLSVTDADPAAKTVAITATLREAASTAKPLIGVPVSLSTDASSFNGVTNANGKVRWTVSTLSRMRVHLQSSSIITYVYVNGTFKPKTIWKSDSGWKFFEWTPVFGAPQLNGTVLSATLSPQEPYFEDNYVTLHRLDPGDTTWDLMADEFGQAEIYPNGSGLFAFDLSTAPASGTQFQFRKTIDPTNAPFYQYGPAVSDILTIP